MDTTSQLQHHGITIAYQTFGNPADPCIILIMGIGGQLIHWPIEITQGLVNQGYYVVTFDNRDMGLSSYYDHIKTPTISDVLEQSRQGKKINPPYTLHEMAADINILMDGLHISKAHILGVSMGGMIAQIFALEYPERVLSLTCIASTTGETHLPPAKPEVLEFFLSGKVEVNDLESYVERMIRIYKIYNHPHHLNEKRLRDLFARAYQRAYHPAGFTRQFLAMMCATPRTEKLKQLKTHSLIIHGDYDPVFPLEHGKHLAECLRNSRLAVIENLGHGLPECLHEKFVEIISDSLRKVSH